MPNESLIARIENILEDLTLLGGQNERTSIVTNLTVVDPAPAGLTDFIIVEDHRDGDYITAKTVSGLTYQVNDKVNVIFIEGTEPIAFQHGSTSSGGNGFWGRSADDATGIFYGEGNVYINDTQNTFSTLGLTINQGAGDNEILSLKSTDVTHTMTLVSDADTYAIFRKHHITNGGLWLMGVTSDETGLFIAPRITNEVTTKTTASNAAIAISPGKIAVGGGVGVMSADANLLSIENHGTPVLIFDAEGTIHTTPGSDIDVDLLTLQVTGTPTFSWDESEDSFSFDKGLRVTSGDVGIGTVAVPHGATGAALIAVEGTDSSTAGPHTQFTTPTDDYPLLGIYPWAHDNVAITFDSYWDGTNWRSSKNTTNIKLYKTDQKFYIRSSNSNAAGDIISPWSDTLVVQDDSKVGIGTDTIPEGFVGNARFVIEGSNTSANGPHIQTTTASDDYPLFGVYSWQHDDVAVTFDAYREGANWKSSDSGSNFQIHKTGDTLSIQYDSAIAAASILTWNPGIVLNTSGQLGIGTATMNSFITAGTPGITFDAAGNLQEVIALKDSTNVNHGMTPFDTDTFASFRKASGFEGGLWLSGITEGNVGLYIASRVISDITTKSTASQNAAIWLQASKWSAGLVSMGADANLVGIASGGTTKVLIDAEGTIHQLPGSDADIDLTTVQVTGTPTFSWDESEDAFSFDKGLRVTSGDIGIGTSSTNSSLTLYRSDETTTLTDYTQALSRSVINIEGDYVVNAYIGGVFWSTQNDNPTKPKAGIFVQETAGGSYMYFGTSNAYATGITNAGALTIDPLGYVGAGTDTPVNQLEVSFSNATTTVGANAAYLGITNTDTTVGNFGGIIFQLDAAGVGSSGISGVHTRGANNEGYLRFETRNSAGAYAERARITADATLVNVIRDLSGGTVSIQDDAGAVTVGTTTGTGKFVVDQSNTFGGIPVITLEQQDVTEEFIRLIGESTTDASQSLVDAVDMTTPGTLTGWFKVYIQDDQATNPIADGVYYVPFYTAPTA